MPFSAVSWAVKQVVSSTLLNQMVENIVTHDHRSDGSQGAMIPAARVLRTTTQAIPNNTYAAITFDEEDFDRGGLWVPGQPTRLTVPVAGIYFASGMVAFSAVAAGNSRGVDLFVNGVAYAGGGTQRFIASAGTTKPTTVQASDLLELAAGDYVELHAYQDTGNSLATAAALGVRANLSLALQSRT